MGRGDSRLDGSRALQGSNLGYLTAKKKCGECWDGKFETLVSGIEISQKMESR